METASNSLSLWSLLLAAFGLWFVIEGLAYAAAPDAMKRFLEWAARMPVPDIRSAGVWTAALGGLMLYIATRLL